MRTHSPEVEAEAVEPDREELAPFTCYEDDGDLVICDKQNPAAWIRADETTDVLP